MDRLEERITRVGAWILENADALLALVAGLVFAILGLRHAVKGDALTAATLGVLAVLAFTVLRERTSRQSFVSAGTEVRETLERLEESVSSLRTPTQYRVIRSEVHWEL
jgi:hypothetical protein